LKIALSQDPKYCAGKFLTDSCGQKFADSLRRFKLLVRSRKNSNVYEKHVTWDA